jgi:hypothetical protein
MAAATLPPNSLIARKMFLTRMDHIVAAALAPHAFRAAVPVTAAEASLAEASFAFRTTKAADAPAQAPDDVTICARGGWEEEPREEGGATEKKEATLHPPDSSPLCFCKRFLLFFFFFGWDIGILPPSIVPCHSEAPPPICVSVFPFLHVNVPGAPSPVLPPRLPLRGHPLPACACAHSIADVQHHSPKVSQAVFPTAAHLPLPPITRPWYSRASFSSCSCRCFAASAPSLAAPSQQHSDTQ